jgi:hypothetical protein
MPAWYRIRDGERFATPSGEFKFAGELIELEADVAALHVARLERVDQAEADGEPQPVAAEGSA